MPHGSTRRRKTPLLPANPPASTPLLVVQSGLLREKHRILAPGQPVQLRDVILWSNEEDALEWGIVYAQQTLGSLSREEYDEVIGRYARPVGEAEWDTIAQLLHDERDAHARCADRIVARRLEMKLLGVDWRFDRTKVTFHFAAEHRVDFRMLVRDLATVFRCRIELHQVGVRDETAIMGGMGSCGRELCCHQHLDEFPAVSVKMARVQNLSLNPSKTSGVCGRLKCCLRYEYDLYEELAAQLPAIGARNVINGEPAEIVQHLPLSGLLVVRFEDGRRETLTPDDWLIGRLAPRRERQQAFAGES